MVRIVCDAVNAVVGGAGDDVRKMIQDMLSYQVEEGAYSPYGGGGWQGTSTMFSWSTNSFPAGFARSIANNLKNKGIECTYLRKPMVEPLGKAKPIINNFPPNPHYAYQDETVERMVKSGGMIAQIATGGGKSQVACKAAARINRMTLFLTTRSLLMFQMADAFQDSIDYRAAHGEPNLKGQKVGVVGAGEFKPSRHINVATVQTISSWLAEPSKSLEPAKYKKQMARRQKMREFLENVTLLILEEAHESSGNSFNDIAKLCKNADYRLALTATPFMKDSTEANMRLMAVSGRIEIKVTEKYLIDRGILAKPYFQYHNSTYVPDEIRLNKEKADKFINFRLNVRDPYQKAYQLGVTYNLARNKLIVSSALSYKKQGLNCMTLVRIERHGQILVEMMREQGIRCDFINGKSSHDVRKKKLKSLAVGEIDVLVGSTILDVGVDVPSVGAVIIAGGGKAEVEFRQRVGRGLRAKKGKANVCFITDFVDGFHKNLLQHSMERKTIVESTPGFAEGIQPTNQQFKFDSILRGKQ